MYEHVRDFKWQLDYETVETRFGQVQEEVARRRNINTQQSSMGIILQEMSQNTVGVKPFKQTIGGVKPNNQTTDGVQPNNTKLGKSRHFWIEPKYLHQFLFQ